MNPNGDSSGLMPQGYNPAPGQGIYENLTRQNSYDATRYAVQNSQQTRVLVEMILQGLRPKDPKGDQNLTAAITQLVGQMAGRGWTGYNPAAVMYGAQQMMGGSGMRVGITSASGQSMTNQFHGAGALTNELSKSFFHKLEKEFFTSMGASRTSRTYGASGTDMGVIMNELKNRGAFAGMNIGEVIQGQDGKLSTSINEQTKQVIFKQMSETAKTLNFMRNIFGSRPAQEMMYAAEQLSGMSFSDPKGPQAIQARLQKSQNAAQAWGKDVRSWMNNELQIASNINAATGSTRMGQAASFDVTLHLERERRVHQEYARAQSARGIYVAPFDEQGTSARLQAAYGGMRNDDKGFGNPFMISHWVLDKYGNLTGEQRGAIEKAQQAYRGARNYREQSNASAMLNQAIYDATGQSIGYFRNMDLDRTMSPERLSQMTAEMNEMQQLQQGAAHVEHLSGGFAKMLGLSDPKQGASAVDLLFRQMTGDERNKMQSILLSKDSRHRGTALRKLLKGTGMTEEQQKELLGLVSGNESAFGRGMGTVAAAMDAYGPLAGYATGAGSAEARESKKYETSNWLNSLSIGNEAVAASTGNFMTDMLNGFFGKAGATNNTAIVQAAKMAGLSTASWSVDKGNMSLKGDKAAGDIENMLKDPTMKAHLNKVYGTTDPKELQKLMAAKNGLTPLLDSIQSGGLEGTVAISDTGVMTFADKAATDKITEGMDKVQAKRWETILAGGTWDPAESEKILQDSASTAGGSLKAIQQRLAAPGSRERMINEILSDSNKGKSMWDAQLEMASKSDAYKTTLTTAWEAERAEASGKNDMDRVSEIDARLKELKNADKVQLVEVVRMPDSFKGHNT